MRDGTLVDADSLVSDQESAVYDVLSLLKLLHGMSENGLNDVTDDEAVHCTCVHCVGILRIPTEQFQSRKLVNKLVQQVHVSVSQYSTCQSYVTLALSQGWALTFT